MIMRKFIGWTILMGSFLLGYLAFPVGAQTPEKVALSQATDAPARLRLNDWPPSGWIVQQFDSLVEIRFPEWPAEVTVPDGLVGQLRQRVADLDTERRGADFFIRLTLGCKCSVAVMADGTDAVVIDVFDPYGSTKTAEGPAPYAAPLPIRKPGTEPARAPSDGRLDVDEARERLMEQLLRAADAGLVDLKPERGTQAPENQEAVEDPSQTEQPVQDAVALDEAVAMDRPKADPKAAADVVVAEADRPRPRPKPACFPDEAFVFPDLLDHGDYAQKASDLQVQLVGEFDAVNEAAALDLARLHLSAGLGVETIAVLDEFVPDHRLAELYREIAMMLDDQVPPPDSSVLKDDCGGTQQLWRAFAKSLDGDYADAVEQAKQATAVLESTQRLMRERISAHIGWAAANSGAWEFARRMDAMATRSVSRAYGPIGRALLLTAKLEEWHGRGKEAFKKLKEARNLPGPVGEEALLQLADAALTKSDLAKFSTAALQEDLAILARADRGGAHGTKAFELFVKLRDHESGRDSALAALDEGVAAGLYPADRRDDLVSDVVGGVDVDDTSQPLALAYLDEPDRFAGALEKPGFRRTLVKSMADLGLPALAEPILRDEDRTDPGTISGLAKAFIAQQEYDRAEALLRGLPENPDRNRMMAEVMVAKGEIDNGQQYLAAADPAEENSEERVRILDSMIDLAVAAGDVDTALDLGTERLSLSADADVAERLALTALDAGREAIPAGLLAALPDQQRARLETLFGRGVDPSEVKDLAGVEGYLDTLNSEISTIEELLKDG